MNLISWQAPEFTYYEKSTGWYTASIVIAVLLVIFALVQGNILFLIFVIIAEILILYWARQIPPLIEYHLDEKGLHIIDRSFYSYAKLSGFAIDTDHPHDPYFELILRPAQKLSTDIKVLFPVEQTDALRERLKTVLPEIDYEESLAERIIKILRF
ncbi:MAG: hypothetical protein Q8P45_02500 [Candidatus Harrisonbacteria bacterium]|nr:hypothetical protein [Candidatus Harrisonbacteria bacterium]